MKKNRKMPDRLMRFLAIFCAAALIIQLVPAGNPMSMIARATESTENGDEASNDNTESNDNTDSKEAPDQESTNKDEKDQETTNNETTENDKKDQEATNDETVNNENAGNGGSNSETVDKETTDQGDTGSNNTDNEPAENTTGSDNTNNDTANTGTDNNDNDNTNTGTDNNNNDNTNSDNTNNGNTDTENTNTGDNTNPTPGDGGNTEPVQEEKELIIKNGSEEVGDSVKVAGEVNLTVSGLGEGYFYSWALENNNVKNAVKLTAKENNTKVTLTPVAGNKGGKIKLTVTAKKGRASESKSVTLEVYTEYGLKNITLKYSKADDTNKENLNQDNTIEITDTLYAEPNFLDNAISDDKDESSYIYQWMKEDSEGNYQKIEGASESSYTPDSIGNYKVAIARPGDDKNYRSDLNFESEKITVTKIAIDATVTVPGKNFDNTTTIPENDSNFTITWNPNKDERTDLKLLLNGEDLATTYSTSLQYSSEGSVSEETEVDIVVVSEKKEFTIASSNADEDFANYKVSVTFNKATISVADMEFEKVATVADEPHTYKDSNKTIWVPANKNESDENDGTGTIAFNVINKDDYTIGNTYDQPDSFKETISVTFSNQENVSFYAKNSAGEIAQITLDNVKIDADAPTVSVEGIKRVSNAEHTETLIVKDIQSGTSSVYYTITNSEETPIFDNTWTKVADRDTQAEFTITVPNYGYVYVYAIDNVGNNNIYKNHSVIYENVPPAVSITCENASIRTITEEKRPVTVNATDPVNGSGIQTIKLSLYKGEKAEGKPIKNSFASNAKNFSNDQFTWKYDSDGYSDAELLENAKNALSREVSFRITNKKLSGVYTLAVEATDNCGNGSLATKTFDFDNEAPKVGIGLTDDKGSAVGDRYYYGASSGDLTVTFSDNLMDSTLSESTYKAVLTDGDEKTLEKTLNTSENNTGSITFSSTEIHELSEGEVFLYVTAVDSANNDAFKISDSISFSPAELELQPEESNDYGWKTASFILDKTSPKASITLTDDKGSAIDGTWYYGAANGGIVVTFTDNYLVGNSDKTIYKVSLQDTKGNSIQKEEPESYKENLKLSYNYKELKNLSEGRVFVVLTAVDAAGNEADKDILTNIDPEELKLENAEKVDSSWKVAVFNLDRTGPQVSIQLEDKVNKVGSSVNNTWYYGASNDGLTVTFLDNYMVGKSDQTTVYKVRLKSKDKTVEKEAENYVGSSAKATFSADEIKTQLSEGEITLSVLAVDAAGNTLSKDAVRDANPEELKFRKAETDDYGMAVASFILDTTNPEIVSIETSGVQGEQDYPITSNKVYTDTNCVFYNKDVKVEIAVVDSYIGKDSSRIKGSLTQIPAVSEPEISVADLEKGNTGIIVTYSLEGSDSNKSAFYKDLTIEGRDYAGNLLKLKTDYSQLVTSDGEKPDDLADIGNGKFKVKYGKVIDQAAPAVTITYESADNPNMYSGEAKVKDRVSAYYNKPVDVKINFADNYELDGSKLYAGLEGSEVQQTGANANTYDVPVIRITRDGRSVYTAYGTDRALNPTLVTENAPDYDKDAARKEYSAKKTASGAFDKEVKVQTPFIAAYEIVLDQTAPVFTLAVESPSSTNKNINAQGNRYYFNNKYTAKLTVTDTNYDASKITVKKGSITSDTYNSETASVDNFPTSITSTSRVFTDSVDADGVYRYAIYGSDKAGNALVPSSAKNLQSTSESKDLVVGQKSEGSLEKEADISNHIVVDKVKPAGELEIKTGKTTIYKMDTKGNVTHAEPYRKETAASFKITVDSNIERSPVNIAYKVDSTSSSDKKNVSNSTYKYNNSADGKQNGKQIFQVTHYKFTDLAGNVTTYGAENKIYLDKDLPTIDKIAPTISIVAKAKSGTNGYRNGQPLFRSDVPLSIVVSDPDSTNSSSGLADVTYQMYVGGNLVSGDTKTLNKANTKTHKSNYKDEKLVYRISPTVNVNGKSHNNNNLEVVVTAYDNAGNKREMKYNFGIDVTAPTVNVTYDNNSAQNQKYFKANRTATIAVTERNFEPSKFRINTQSGASISGWSHKSNGGNGDKDVWTATVTYNKDGNYTLEVSGEDLLGNKASDIKYNGTAPREFTVDKTFPSISVTYDNNDVRNGKYYKATRTATVNVTDVNFNGQNTIVVRADEGGVAPGVRFNGNTSRLPFLEDGVYSFQGTVTDMAGNEMRIPDQAEFVIDTKVPVLIFEEGKPFEVIKATETGKSDHPVNMQFFTEDGFAPVVTVVDKNISTAEADAIFEVIGQKMANHFTGEAVVDANDNTKFTMGLSSLVFRVTESIDDVYHVRAQAIDMAGNESELIEFDFSINRFGSSYAADKDDRDEAVSPYSTYGYIRDSYYHNSTQDLTIYEYNTNGLKKNSQKVEMMKDGNTATIKTLTAGTDYIFEEVPNKGSKLRTYRYIIKSSVFEEEGDYSFTISSVDEAGHNNTTSRVHRGTDENGKEKLYVDSFPIDFVIDKTAPTNQLAGVKADRKQSVNDTSLVVDVYPEDAQTAVSKVEIRRWMGDTLGLSTPAAAEDPVQTIVYEYYDEKTNPKPADTDTEQYEDLATYTDQTTDQIKINYEIKDNQNWQWVEVVTTDLAGNESTDIRAGALDGAESVSYTENRRGFLVTTNAISQVVNNMAARIGAGAAIVLILLFLFMRKRKKDQANAA